MWSGGPVQFCHPSWVVSGFSELDWGFVELLRTYKVHFSASGCALHPGLCLGWALWGIPCYVFSWSGDGVSFAFVTGFVAKTQAPPLLLGLRASLYRPNQRETIVMGDCYILCGRSGITCSAWAAHRQRCEWFLFAAGCNMKELSKTTVSFWLRTPLSRVCWLSVTGTVCFVSLELSRSFSYPPPSSHWMSRLGVRVCLHV